MSELEEMLGLEVLTVVDTREERLDKLVENWNFLNQLLLNRVNDLKRYFSGEISEKRYMRYKAQLKEAIKVYQLLNENLTCMGRIGFKDIKKCTDALTSLYDGLFELHKSICQFYGVKPKFPIE